MSARVVLVRTGTANIASVSAALRREGCEPVLTEDAGDVRTAERLVLPGVGAFGAAMANLERAGLAGPLRERIEAGRPTLAVCLGLQLFAEESEEAPGVRGLSLFPGRARRFVGDLRVPHLGWNEVRAEAGGAGQPMVESGYAYFANTYHLDSVPAGWTAARCRYGTDFVAAAERGSVLACQFHPELSGAWGKALLRRWIERSTC